VKSRVVMRRRVISVNFIVVERCGGRLGGRQGETTLKKFLSF
jgi:hypothetical protein